MKGLLWILLLIAGCQSPLKESKNTLKICFSRDPSTLDPRKSSDYASSTLICLLFEGLTRCKSGSEIEPGIAQRVEISNDGKTYLFHLRKTNWSDGSPVTANDFEASWKEILTPGFPAPCAYLLYPIKNAENYAKGLCAKDDVGITSLDDSTLKVELESPTPHFLSLTAFPLLLPSKNSLCNGPFLIEKMKVGSEILLAKNKGFWDPQKVSLSEIHISIIPEETTALNLFEKGEIDIIGGPLTPIPIESMAGLKGAQNMPMEASTFCVMNTKTLPFSNASIRKAFTLSIQNSPVLTQEIKEMGQIPAKSMLPPSLSLRDSLPYEGNAQELLAQGLKEIGKDSLKGLVLNYKPSPIEKKIAQTLQKIWEDELGIRVHLEQLDATSLIQKLYAKNYDLSITSWIAQVHDPINLLERFKEENPKNYSSWSDDNYRALLEKATSSIEQRTFYLEKAQAVLEETMPIIPLYHWNFPLLVNPRINSPPITDSGGILFEKASINPSYK